jgi:ubiquinol-cytochrome c reductase cytochrome c subunit
MTELRARSALRLPAAALLLAVGCSYSGDEIEPSRPPVVAQRAGVQGGSELYARDCAWCHGNRGQGTEFAPDLTSGENGPALTHFMVSSGRMPLDFPEQRTARRPSNYSDEEIGAIVDYVASFDQPGPDVPQVDVSSADLALGGELYQENCAACHSTVGIGGALASGRTGELPEVQTEPPANVAPGLADASPTEIAEAILTGPGTMPVFGAETLSKEQLDSIVRYVVALQHPDNRGGAGLGGTGPVAEGALGWILGMGMLLALTRWLGTKAGEDDERESAG